MNGSREVELVPKDLARTSCHEQHNGTRCQQPSQQRDIGRCKGPLFRRRSLVDEALSRHMEPLFGNTSARSSEHRSSLSRAEFARAVKDALRHYTQADMLAKNALLHSGLLRHSEARVATPQVLSSLLVETAEYLFVSARDQSLYRVLEQTYLKPAPKQAAAADRLGLSFSTYRRRLIAAVDRLTQWLWLQEQEVLRAEAEVVTELTTGPAAADEESTLPPQRRSLSIVILPFLNLTQDPSMDYLVDGIGDSLITDLSRALPGSFVISRSTAFTYKGRQTPIPQIGRELGVRYVLDGSVMADRKRVRINVQLIDAATDEHLWVERFDKERKDILEIQDEIVARLSRSVGIEMIRCEAARGNAANAAS